MIQLFIENDLPMDVDVLECTMDSEKTKAVVKLSRHISGTIVVSINCMKIMI